MLNPIARMAEQGVVVFRPPLSFQHAVEHGPFRALGSLAIPLRRIEVLNCQELGTGFSTASAAVSIGHQGFMAQPGSVNGCPRFPLRLQIRGWQSRVPVGADIAPTSDPIAVAAKQTIAIAREPVLLQPAIGSSPAASCDFAMRLPVMPRVFNVEKSRFGFPTTFAAMAVGSEYFLLQEAVISVGLLIALLEVGFIPGASPQVAGLLLFGIIFCPPLLALILTLCVGEIVSLVLRLHARLTNAVQSIFVLCVFREVFIGARERLLALKADLYRRLGFLPACRFSRFHAGEWQFGLGQTRGFGVRGIHVFPHLLQVNVGIFIRWIIRQFLTVCNNAR